LFEGEVGVEVGMVMAWIRLLDQAGVGKLG
jgi:hypothetical protein